MNRLLLDPEEIADDGRVRLVDRRADHLRKVLRVEAGKAVRAGVVRGPLLDATVVAVSPEAVELETAPRAGAAPPKRPPVDLVVALPRPQILHRVLQFAAAMGVARVDLVAAWRVEKSYFQSPSAQPDAIARHLRLGTEQGGGTWVPEAALHHRLVPLVTQLQSAAPRRRLLAHPGQAALESRLGDQASGEPLCLAIGPEGGWIDREVETWRAAGFEPVSLGPWVLRVEAAVVAALAQIDLLDHTAATSPRGTRAVRAGGPYGSLVESP